MSDPPCASCEHEPSCGPRIELEARGLVSGPLLAVATAGSGELVCAGYRVHTWPARKAPALRSWKASRRLPPGDHRCTGRCRCKAQGPAR